MFGGLDPDAGPSVTGRVWRVRAAHLLFAGVMWFIATFAFFGELGQWRDDPAYCFRSPVTGANLLTFGEPTVPYFFRPLYYMTQPWQQSQLGGHWTNHLISAIVQGIIGVLVYRLLRRQGVWRGAASAAAVVLWVMPQTWEISFYLAAMPTGLSCVTFLLLSLVSLRWFRGKSAGWRTCVMPAWIFVLALAVPCWNEQIGAAAPAMFFLSLGERRADGKRPWARGVAAAGAACAAQMLYVALYWGTQPGASRGSSGSIVGVSELPKRVMEVVRGMETVAFMRHRFGADAMHAGVRAITEHPGAAAVMIGCVVVASLGWLVRVARTSHVDSANASGRRAMATIAYGTVVFLLSWAPVVMVRGEQVESRTWFPPAIGVVIAVAGAFQLWLGARHRVGSCVRLVLAAGFIALCAPSLVALVGIQSALHERMKLDAMQAEQLMRLVPKPAPWTAFVPLEVMGPNNSRWSRFSSTFTGPWEHGPASTPSLRAIYRRNDLAMGWRRPWNANSPRLNATSEGLIYDDRTGPDQQRLYRGIHGAKAPPTLIQWSRVVPFVLDPEGNVVLVHLVSVKPEGGPVQRFPVESVRRIVAANPGAGARLAHVRLRPETPATVHPVAFTGRSN